MAKAAISLLLSGLVLSACAPLAREEATPVLPAQFERTASRPAAVNSRWWTRFGSPMLNTLVERADAGNFDLAAANARIEQAEAQARISGAVLFPALSASGDGARAQGSGTMGSRRGPFISGSPSNSFSGVLAASYELDLWGRNRDLLSASKAEADSSLYAREVLRLSMRAGVANAWFALAAARERLRIAQENVTNASRIAEVVKQRLAVGTGSALEVAQQESLIAQQRAAIPELRQAAENNRLALALLMGRVPEGLTISTPPLRAIGLPGIKAGLPSQLLVRRPDIRQAEAQLEAAQASLSAARKAMLPQISLSGQGGQRSAALANLLRPESAIWSLAVGLTQPIFDGGRLAAQADLAEAQKRELLENYRKSIVSALVDVENALVAVREGAAREAAISVVVARSREAFKLAEERLRAGTIDLTTLLNTQATLFNAQDNLVQARLARLNAAVSLFQALGGDFTVEISPAQIAAMDPAPEVEAP